MRDATFSARWGVPCNDFLRPVLRLAAELQPVTRYHFKHGQQYPEIVGSRSRAPGKYHASHDGEIGVRKTRSPALKKLVEGGAGGCDAIEERGGEAVNSAGMAEIHAHPVCGGRAMAGPTYTLGGCLMHGRAQPDAARGSMVLKLVAQRVVISPASIM